MTDGASAASSAPPKQKRSFFKKPSWKQKSDNTEDDDPVAMFDGAKQTFSAIMEEQEHARKKKQQEQEEKARMKELIAARQGKRRKVADDDEPHNGVGHEIPAPRKDGKKSRSASSLESCMRLRSTRSPRLHTNVNSLSARYEAAAEEKKAGSESALVIDLGDSDSDYGSSLVKESEMQATESVPADADDAIDESDPEIREIIRETRRKQRLANEQKAAPGSPARSQHEPSPGTTRGSSTPLQTSPPDPAVQILITSRIPGTRPLIVTRKLSQRLQEVRHAWCQRQGFEPEVTDSVFFTFKGRRLYDVATCRSLGLVVDDFGNVYMKDNPDWDESDGKVTLEAVTMKEYEEDLRQARQQRDPKPEPEPELELVPELEPEQKRIRVIIKTKAFGDAKFTCGPDTTFGKLAKSSLIKLEVSGSKRPYILFDGERLNPSGTMADLDDFEDGDALEMHFD